MIADDKYTYPGSGGVLVNNYNIRDAEQLDKAVNAVAGAPDALPVTEERSGTCR